MFNLHQQCLRNQGYEPLDLLGQGSFSSVYTVQDVKSKHLKAVKIIENQVIRINSEKEQSTNEQKDHLKANQNDATKQMKSIEEIRRKKLREHKAGQKYFNREIITSRRLIQSYHPSVVKVFSIKKTFLYTYIYMEHLSKGNLNDYLNKNGPLEPDDDLAKLWIYQLASALEYLHSIGIAHRDVKLQNIGLTEQLNAKLIDFGFACKCVINKSPNHVMSKSDHAMREGLINSFNILKSDLSSKSRSVDSNLVNLSNFSNLKANLETQSSIMNEQVIVQFSMSQCGTPLYIAPEVIIADKCPYDPRKADIWSLGVAMFAIISYRYPFTKRDYKILYKQQLKKSWISKRVYTCFSIEAFDLIRFMLEPMPKRRFSARQVMQHKWIKSYTNKSKEEHRSDCELVSTLHNKKDDKCIDTKGSSKLNELKILNEQMKNLNSDDAQSEKSFSDSESYSFISDESIKKDEPVSQSILSTLTGLDSKSCI